MQKYFFLIFVTAENVALELRTKTSIIFFFFAKGVINSTFFVFKEGYETLKN